MQLATITFPWAYLAGCNLALQVLVLQAVPALRVVPVLQVARLAHPVPVLHQVRLAHRALRIMGMTITGHLGCLSIDKQRPFCEKQKGFFAGKN